MRSRATIVLSLALTLGISAALFVGHRAGGQAPAPSDPSGVPERSSDPERAGRADVTGLFATSEEVRTIYRPRWDQRWELGVPHEPDHRGTVERLADQVRADERYEPPFERFDSGDFRQVALRFSALAWRYLAEASPDDLATATRFIVAQASDAAIDWDEWPRGNRDQVSDEGSGPYADSHAVAGLVHGYSIVRGDLSQEEQHRVDRWFQDWAELAVGERQARMRSHVSNWDAATDPAEYIWDHDEPIERSVATIGVTDKAYFGSPTLRIAHYNYNNRWSSMMRTVAMIGVVVDDDALKQEAARFFRESLAFGWWPEGFHVDFHRGIGDGSIAYAALATSNLVTIADVLLRDGYIDLYAYETDAGIFGTSGAFPGRSGKRLDWAIVEMAKHYTGEYVRFASTTAAEGPTMGSRARGDQLRFALANVYYRDTGLPRELYACGRGDACPVVPESPLDDAWTLDKEAGPTLFHVAADREDGAAWPYPDVVSEAAGGSDR